jgi:GT2 family glycosyltransferase
MNNDNEVPEDYLFNLANHYLKYPNSIITSVVHDIKTNKLISPGFRQNWLFANTKAINFDEDHLPNNLNLAEVTHASGRGTLFPLEVYKNVGLYDEKHLPHYGADDDLSFKATRTGFKIYIGKDCRVLSHIEQTGMTQVLNNFSIKSFLNYLTNIRSPASLSVRFWYGWNNCPKLLFPSYILLDFIRIIGGYFKSFVHAKNKSHSKIEHNLKGKL